MVGIIWGAGVTIRPARAALSACRRLTHHMDRARYVLHNFWIKKELYTKTKSIDFWTTARELARENILTNRWKYFNINNDTGPVRTFFSVTLRGK